MCIYFSLFKQRSQEQLRKNSNNRYYAQKYNLYNHNNGQRSQLYFQEYDDKHSKKKIRPKIINVKDLGRSSLTETQLIGLYNLFLILSPTHISPIIVSASDTFSFLLLQFVNLFVFNIYIIIVCNHNIAWENKNRGFDSSAFPLRSPRIKLTE